MMDRVIAAYGQQEGLEYTLFRPFNWIGPGLDSIHTPKEGSSRVITQFLGHIVRGEPIKLVDGGAQKRSFTYVSDGIVALMKIIDNPGGIAAGKIYNIGNPKNNYSIRELATLMLDLAKQYPEYAESVAKVKTDTVAGYVFVVSIDGVEGKRGDKAWYYMVDGKEADKLASSNILNDADLMKWEYKKDTCSEKVDKDNCCQ